MSGERFQNPFSMWRPVNSRLMPLPYGNGTLHDRSANAMYSMYGNLLGLTGHSGLPSALAFNPFTSPTAASSLAASHMLYGGQAAAAAAAAAAASAVSAGESSLTSTSTPSSPYQSSAYQSSRYHPYMTSPSSSSASSQLSKRVDSSLIH